MRHWSRPRARQLEGVDLDRARWLARWLQAGLLDVPAFRAAWRIR